MFNKKTIKNIDLKDKTVLLRADFNVPLEEDGSVADDYRISQTLPTIESLLEQNCKIIIISHLGRPEGKVDPKLSLKPVAEILSKLVNKPVEFGADCVGVEAKTAIDKIGNGELVLLENLRFHSEEKDNDKKFAKKLAGNADVFVQDGFGVVHRAHASTEAITKFLPAVAGLLIEREVSAITRAVQHPHSPLVTIVGGAKIETKIDLLGKFIEISDSLVIGGAMANTFLKAMSYEIGKSKYDEDEVDHANRIIQLCKHHHTDLILPMYDVAVSKEVKEGDVRREINTPDVEPDDYILDFGVVSTEHVLEIIKIAGTVIWNGPLGMIEIPAFQYASESIARYLASGHEDAIVGGGDTAGFIHELGLVDQFEHVSTGGGASLELMSGKPLPGVAALEDK